MASLVLGIGLLFAAALVAGNALSAPARARRSALQRALAPRRLTATPHDQPQEDFRDRVLRPLGGRMARLTLRLSPQTNVDNVRERLVAAGRHGTSPSAFLSMKAVWAVGGVIFGLLLGAPLGPLAGVGLALCFGAVGFILPEMRLSSQMRERVDDVQAELPDALELLAVTVESGLSFDAGIAKLTHHLKGTLVDELSVTLTEMRIGLSRQQALRQLARRVQAPELAAFVRAVIQAEQLGMPLGRVLKIQADEARTRRAAAAEERAMKAPVKMLFPTVVFIFPSLFIVILGPAMIDLLTVF